MRAIFILLCTFAIVACAKKTDAAAEVPPVQPAAETARTIVQGDVIGAVGDHGVHVWKGLPFAAAPEGENRWRAPRPPENWEGVREALEFSERCVQVTNAFSQSEGEEPGKLVGDEDCLYLNVYAPATSAGDASALPVMVWIHGGGNVWGSARQYDPSALVKNENVIVVTVQYRMGPLGFFSHEALRAGAQIPEDATANFGVLDLVASLQWVRDNIAAFGGAPGKVTIFGESAGGHNTAALMAAPQARGLFHRAIMQSGFFASISRDEAENGGPIAPHHSGEIVETLGVETADGLRGVSTADLYAAYNTEETGYLDLPLMVEDGVTIPSGSLVDAFGSTDTFSPVPLITGTNKDEMKLFLALDPRLINRYFGVLITPKKKKFYNALSDYQSRIWRIRSIDDAARQMANAGHDQVYGYRFDWDEGGRFLITDLSVLLGAAHGLDIPFVMNRFVFAGSMDRLLFTKKTAESRETLSRAMGAYWAAFARTGAPSAQGLPAWPAFGADGAVMRFDSNRDAGIGVMTGVDTIEALLDDFKSDERLKQKERCLVADAMKTYAPEFSDLIDGAVSCSS